ncbi:unnamed protein product [Tetraodon nigroviridis]|uniref:Chromosome undetermined SCAF13832, whole genome shotgun sequence n=1 Tax=Tetraodon nigroviridis TaxID=99883 RepID=Q4SV06_TETNG|nr:unnamed protein product [Tetraodon nigroviridis]
MAAPSPVLVSAKWLSEMAQRSLGGPRLRVLDASWYLPMMRRDGRKEFLQAHIAGASFFDIDECVDPASKFDHTLPSPEIFADYVGNLGVGNDSHVVVYDASDFGAFTCTRVWWMFRFFGHPRVSVLNGGLRNWVREGHPVTAGHARAQPARFTATRSHPSWVKSFEEVTRNISQQEFQVVDVRPLQRFLGVQPGHIPLSKCMPFFGFLDHEGMFLPTEQLKQFFEKSQVDLKKPLGLVYDGSWYEWFSKAPPEHVISQIRSLVSAQWLADAIKNNLVGPKLRVLDTSWYLPKTKRDPKAEFVQKHIPGSSFFDIDECSDRSSALDHMLPSPELFSRYVGALGIGNDTHVVVYDTSDFGSYSAPRVWWMFRLFGHSLVSVLEGGWRSELAEVSPPPRKNEGRKEKSYRRE